MFDFKKVEQEVLSFWKAHQIFERSLDARRRAKRFVFFEGPPTANGRPGIHHFLGRAFKDLYCRYKTMRGFYVLRKAGWDTHGLPVELEVEKELGFKNKKDIEKYGIAEFNKKAKESVWKYKTEWEEMTKQMGYWLDMGHPYVTYENKYIESLWTIVKKIWDKKLLYLAHRVVPFCTRCGTPLSSHEVAQGYRTTTDRSVIVKFSIFPFDKLRIPNALKDNFQFSNKLQIPKSSKLYILAWTTTPWTLPGNVALAVGKKITYVIFKIKDQGSGVKDVSSKFVTHNSDLYIAAKDRLSAIVESYEIVQELKGEDLVGLEYEPLFGIKKLKSEKSYKIYDADFVSTKEGTGVVHTAVMYGEDDYDLGTKLGLPKFHTVNEQGKFAGVSDVLDGKYVKDSATEDLLIRELEIRNLLFKVEDFEHDYPFCWRCDTPLLYYAKESWFIKISALNKQLLENNQKINWIPAHIKEGRFGQWLKEGKDWAFSRERYWGTPLPVWICGKTQTGISKQKGCGHVFVVGSLEDLEKHRYKPKNEFYILRHGHSEKNGKEGDEIISSKVESDKYHLTNDGRGQVKKSTKQLKGFGGVDIIISSPFIRTRETAMIVAEELGLDVKIEPALGEIQHGELCEGRTHNFCVTNHKQSQSWKTKTADGESWQDVRKRMSGFLRELDSKHEGKNILIISHGDPLWLLETFALGLGPEETIASRDSIFPSQGELKKIDLKNWPYDDDGELDLHRPYIDRIILKCPRCKSKMVKVPDLIDVWFDSGAMPYAQWHWPFENKDMIDPPSLPPLLKLRRSRKIRRTPASLRQFPADFISEGVDQTRGWFYTLLAVSTLLDKGVSYKNVMVYGLVLDEQGQKMSKSKGNIVSPFEVVDKFGADAARWYFYTINSPGDYKLFSVNDVRQRLTGFITTLDNCVRFYELYSDGSKTKDQSLTPHALDFKLSTLNLLDRWVLSKLNGLVAETTDHLDNYDPTSAARAAEKFIVDDLSNWWLRRSRKRREALGLLRFTLLELAKIIAPFTPFIAEDIHKRLHKRRSIGTDSVHLHDWPESNKKSVDKELEGEMYKVREVVTAGLALRKEKQIKVRQPLAELRVGKELMANGKWPDELKSLIKEELNVKEVVYDGSQKEEVVLNTELTQPLVYEGYARELMRQIQDMRKEAKYRLDDRIFGQWHSDDKDVSEAIARWSDEIKSEVLLSEFRSGPHDSKAYNVEKEFDLAPQKKIWIGLRK